MADVDTYSYTSTKVRKTKKTTSTKRRESQDGGDVSITEITEKENHVPALTNGTSNGLSRKQRYLLVSGEAGLGRFEIVGSYSLSTEEY